MLNSANNLKKTIAIFQQYPIADKNCVKALKKILKCKFNLKIINRRSLTRTTLSKIDCIIFPGGLGDVDLFDNFLSCKKRIIRKYVSQGGKYIGICMGSYFAGKYYFNLLGNVYAVRYIKRLNSDVKTSRRSIINCDWGDDNVNIFFYDGAAFIGVLKQKEIVMTYSNGDIAAVLKTFKKGLVLAIGPHPEALRSWYNSIKKIKYWDNGYVHKKLLTLITKVVYS